MESDTKKLTDTTKLLRECDAGTRWRFLQLMKF